MASSLPRKSYARIPVNLDLPNLIEIQLDSFERLKKEGLGDLFHEISPIIGASARARWATRSWPRSAAKPLPRADALGSSRPLLVDPGEASRGESGSAATKEAG